MERENAEALNRLICCALANSATPSLPDGADPLSALTDADRATFEALGTPEEVARRVFARIERNVPSQYPARASTIVNDQCANDTIPNGSQKAGAVDPVFDELLAHHAACCRLDRFEWNYQFVKQKEEIGQGGQGVVYRIECLEEFVGNRALKILSPEPYGDAQSYDEDMQRMRAVAAAVHQIYHDNVLYVERFEPHGDIYVMVMRMIDGFDLQRLLCNDEVERLKQSVHKQRWSELDEIVFARCGTDRRGLTPGVAVNIIEKCLRGASALHNKNIVHCDIKPSNIMLDCHGSIRLIDIGSAFQLDARPRRHAWTPRYAPPEVLEHDQWTVQGDLASLGYVLIELLSGRPDLMGPPASSESVHTLDMETRAKLAEAKRQLPDRLEHLIPVKAGESKSLIKLCKSLIHPDPTKRFASAEQAFDWTAQFKDELVVARLAMPWVKVIKHWVTEAKIAMSDPGSTATKDT